MTGIKDVVVFVDGRMDGTGVIEFAARLAQEHGAEHLAAAFVWPPLVSEGSAAYVRGSAIQELLACCDAEVSRRETHLRRCFESAAARGALHAEWRSVRSSLTEDMVVHARYADIAIVGRPDPARLDAIPHQLPQTLVLASGRPVLLLPSEPPLSAGRRILVGWNARREATRAVADAMPFLARAEAVEVLVVDHERHPADHGEEPGADIGCHLARHGVRVGVCRMASEGQEVGRLMLSRAAAFGADLIVMGAYGHSRLTELVFGGATRSMLREATLPVLMSR
jgi:nucleotide-binding universal stress UspA family protein